MKIRYANKNDVASILKIYAYYVENTAITFECKIPEKEEFEKRMEKILSKYPYIVIEDNNKILGYAYANFFKDREAYDLTVESSIYVDKNYLSKGIGKLLYSELEKELVKMGIVTIEACITYPNEKSEQFHLKNGYKKVAHFNKVGYKFNNWYDVVFYEKKINNTI